MKISSHLVVSLAILVIILLFSPIQIVFSQTSEELSKSQMPRESIKIDNPVLSQKASMGKGLIISGHSSDNNAKNCSVSVIVNDIRPYQNAIAKGRGGINDFSQWEFSLRNDYAQLIEGENKITAKLICESAPTRWNSVFINGVPNYSNEEILSPVQSKQRSDVSTMNLSDIKDAAINTKTLLVSVFPQKNAVARGDAQNATITVTDSESRVVSNAEIAGKLIYPGGNYEKEFKGKTDLQGKFVYSWVIGKNGDLGPLTMEVETTSQGFSSSPVTSSFDIIDSSSASGINDKGSGNYLEGKKSEFDFVMAGDYGCDSKTKQTINNMKKEGADLVFALGDLSEVGNPECFFKLISKLDGDQKFKVTLGESDTDSNEVRSSSRFSDFVRHFNLETPFYSFDYQNVHFLAMSTGKSLFFPYENGSAQYNFINDDLHKATNDPNIDWIIVYGYRPLYTSPTIHPAGEVIRKTYAPLFEKYGVDLVITSHNHNYQRSYPLLYNIQDSRQPIIKDTNATQYYMPGVPIYVGVGTAGNNLYDFRGQAPFMVTQFRENGFLHVNITDIKNQDVLTGSFRNIGSGALDDQFVITKSKTD